MFVVAGLIAIPAFVAPTDAAQQYCQFSEPGSFHCFSQYDAPSDAVALRVSCDRLPATMCPADGHFDFGGVIYDGGRSPNHQNNGGDPDRDLPLGSFRETVYVHDVVFGQNVGVFYCQDVDGDGLCGEGSSFGRPAEPASLFCGHADLGAIDTTSFVWAGYYVVGPLFQERDCPGSRTTNPVGGTVGTISIWLAPVPGPSPPACRHDGIDYGVWGGGATGDTGGSTPGDAGSGGGEECGGSSCQVSVSTGTAVCGGDMACDPDSGTASTRSVIIGSPDNGTFVITATGRSGGGTPCVFEVVPHPESVTWDCASIAPPCGGISNVAYNPCSTSAPGASCTASASFDWWRAAHSVCFHFPYSLLVNGNEVASGTFTFCDPPAVPPEG